MQVLYSVPHLQDKYGVLFNKTVSEMKFIFGIALLFLGMLNSVSCNKKSRSMEQPIDASDESSQSHERIDDQIRSMRRASDREFFYSASPSIEQLLGVPDDLPSSRRNQPVLTNAFVISFTNQDSIIVRENILGSIPVDYKTLVPDDSMPGDYLVGLLMPQGGWTIGRTQGRASFCLPLRPDGSFSYGFEGELTESLATIREYKTTDR
jgi:hypothetical protein